MSNQNTALNPIAIGDAMRMRALSYAAKTGTAIDLAVVTAANAKDDVSMGPIALYRAMKANLSEEEIDGLPLPGSRWKDDAGVIHNNADICQWKDPSKPDAKAKEISFYIVWADNTPEGKHVVTELEWLSRVSQDNMKTDDIDDKWLAKYASNPELIKKRKKYLEARRAYVRQAYKTAVRLIWQIDLVNELEGCEAELPPADTSDTTIVVKNKANPQREWKLYTVGAFLKLDAKKASETGGSYAALEATAKRVPTTEPEKGGEIKLNAIHTPASADKVATAFHLYIHGIMKEKNGADYAAYLKHLMGPGGQQAVLTLDGIRKELNSLFKMDALRAIADTEAEKLSDAA